MLLLILGILLLSMILLLAYVISGGLSDVLVRVGRPWVTGSCKIAYKVSIGPYSNIGAYFREMDTLVPGGKLFGVYYDDPRHVVPIDLRWAAGVILEMDGQKCVDAETVLLLERRGYLFSSLPAIDNAIIAQFPNLTRLSCLVGAKRVYAKINEFEKETNLGGTPALEFYGLDPRYILYMMPLEKHNEFLLEHVPKR